MSKCDVVILGAGPYDLAAGAHLSNIKGLQLKVFAGTEYAGSSIARAILEARERKTL